MHSQSYLTLDTHARQVHRTGVDRLTALRGGGTPDTTPATARQLEPAP
jgi:hypothetical protein